MSSAARITKKPKPAPAVLTLPDAIPHLPVRRFTVSEYHELIRIGLLKSGEPYELIHGWIVKKMGINPPHEYAVDILPDLLKALVGTGRVVRAQHPITMNDSEPEPDVVIVTGARQDFKTRHPKPTEVELVVEVADASLREDQTTKLALYAGAKIVQYWIVNLIDRRIEVYTQPRGGKNPAYRTRTDYGSDDAVPVVIAGEKLGTIAVKELLP